MLVVDMNSKRQRRPNVRLGEIGDLSAAFACGFPERTQEKLGPKRWKHDGINSKQIEPDQINGFSEERYSQLADSDPAVSPGCSADFQQNRENNNPNSSKSAIDVVKSNQLNVTKSKLDFGNITRKCRVMKRRGRSSINDGGFFCGGWNSRLSPGLSCEEGRVSAGKEFARSTSVKSNDQSMDYGFKDFSDRKTPSTGKEASEYDVYESTWQQASSQDTCGEGEDNNASPVPWDEIRCIGNAVGGVERWLEELGFGKYADLFEMHEVDEEVLPLLTLEDLKEMGVFAVGPRRKLYTAIRQLRMGNT
ncbi:hypothetical protein L6164_011282 [Bauhinia variegata]|uniref:Uncharacterized protein n=1 Tax=Bauhinia variegata TaxID=167791 RepID=A0ACB9P803_BAUVA|nr:hypothetical protein L6164_011282 [Bauhinia variegata]